MPEPTGSPGDYDTLPYEGLADPMMHPNRAAGVARLHGMECASPDAARILDVGCATGGHTIPIAYQFPRAQVRGFDYSSGQIERARGMTGAVGVGNLEFEVRDLQDSMDDLGEFDFIIVHGVYSWVSGQVRQRVMELCRGHLSPRGVAMIDYNVLPGWRLKGMLGDVAAAFGREGNDLAGQMRGALEVLDLSERICLCRGRRMGRVWRNCAGGRKGGRFLIWRMSFPMRMRR